MPKKILVNVIPEEIRMALVEEGQLLEVAVERPDNAPVLGNIYKGRVENVLPGMQAAFINIGLARNAFLYAGDIFPHKSFQRLVKEDNLTVGAEIMVEIVKDALGTKGPRATTHFSIPGRYIVLMPTVDYVGVSRRIASAEERSRLREISEKIRPKGMGIIVRTVAEGHSEESLIRDFQYLSNLWEALNLKAKRAKPPFLLYRDADLVIRIIRDHMKDDVEEVQIDNAEAYARMIELAKYISPDIVKKIHLYRGKTEIFTHYGIEEEWGRLTARRVDLKCGGYIIIDRTEALTVVDVNTGRFIGHTSLADTVFRTNMEAAAEIARQLRLRDIGGIIVIDFIDMEKEGHRKSILTELEAHLRQDSSKSNVLGLTELGLVEMTRKKARQTVEGTLYEECPCCLGRGTVQSPDTLMISIRRQLRKIAIKRPGADIVVQVHPRLISKFGSEKEIRALSEDIGLELTIESLETIHPEHYALFEGEKSLYTSNQPKKQRKVQLRAENEEAQEESLEAAPLSAEDFALEAAADPAHSLEQKLAAMSDSFWEPMPGLDEDETETQATRFSTDAVDEYSEADSADDADEDGETPRKKPRRRRKRKKVHPVVFEAPLASAGEPVAELSAVINEEGVPADDAAGEDLSEVLEVANKKSRRRRRRKKTPKELLDLAIKNLPEEQDTTEPETAAEEPEQPVVKKSKRRRRRKKTKIEDVATDITAEEEQLATAVMEEEPIDSSETLAPAKKHKRRRRKKKPATAEVEQAAETPQETEKQETDDAATENPTKKPRRRRRRSSPKKTKPDEAQAPSETPD